jgi:hypothetical protein
MTRVFDRLWRSDTAPWIGAALTLALGLVFAFIWAPHPWGWRGIDQYHQLAVALARGEPFATTDVPWAYAYYVAVFYALFGDHAWIPVLVQVIINASVPVLLYAIVAPLTSRHVAGLAALLTGVFSFNTVYASTQSSDALCTVTFLGALLSLVRAHRTPHLGWYALAGLLSGLMPQFRPNLILLPPLAAVMVVVLSRNRGKALVGGVAYLTVFAAALAPWTIRNYRLTETFLPTSSHGGVQLWYGTLQVGEYLESRAHNPRSVFETAAFDYFSIAGPSIIVSASLQGCAPGPVRAVVLRYRTDRDPLERALTGTPGASQRFTFEIPGQPVPTAIYYWFETTWSDEGDAITTTTPAGGGRTPLVFFVTDDHLGNQDRRDDLLDVFDVASMVATTTTVTPPALAESVLRLLPSAPAFSISIGADANSLRFADGSQFVVPHDFSRATDLHVVGPAASALSYARLPRWLQSDAVPPPGRCRQLEDITVNDRFDRREPHMMRRYTALAFDNIRRDPVAFVAASIYRAGRLFVIRGTSDEATTQQFDASGRVYFAGTLLTAAYLTLFVVGAALAIRDRMRVRLLLIPIVYVPATICFVLTNMRYTITVQPLMFVFVAIGLLALTDRQGSALVDDSETVDR